MPLPLPPNPDLDWLRKQAKRLLQTLRETRPDAQLSEAQLDLARAYGFSSWRALKTHVDGLAIDPILSSALEQAERASPAVKAAALMNIARVVDVRSHDDAMRLLDQGIAIAETLREPLRSVLRGDALTAAASVAPHQALRLLSELRDDHAHGHRVTIALRLMFEQGHHETAIRYLLSVPIDSPNFPYDVLGNGIALAPDDRTRVVLLRRALEAARSTMALARPRIPAHTLWDLLPLFSERWRVLGAEEAGAVVREMVAAIVAAPDERGSFTAQGVRFSSSRQYLLFNLFGPCRHLEPRLADKLLVEYQQLAKAVRQYPFGLESIYDMTRPRADASRTGPAPEPDLAERAQMDYLTLDQAFLPVAEELRTDFARAFRIALDAFADDTDPRRPNQAPQHCWPSAASFRSILYKAAQYEGRQAERHLERVPDATLRLFAHIELAAALAGVRQVPNTILRQLPDLQPPGRPSPRGRDEDVEDVPPGLPTFAAVFDKPDITPSYDAQIAPTRHARGTPPTGGCDADFWVIDNARLRPVVAELFDVSPIRIVLPPSLDEQRYDFKLVLPQDESREVLMERMRAGVEQQFDVRWERQSIEARVLTAPNGVQARATMKGFEGGGGGIGGGSFGFYSPQDSTGNFDDLLVSSLMSLDMVPSALGSPEDQMRAAQARFMRMHAPGALSGIHQSLTMSELCVLLETALDTVFVDESGTSAGHQIDIEMDPNDRRDFLQVLCEELGLVITQAWRDVDVLVVRER